MEFDAQLNLGIKKLPLRSMPTPEAFKRKKFYIVGCTPDIPTPRDWVFYICNTAFFNESNPVIQSFEEFYPGHIEIHEQTKE